MVGTVDRAKEGRGDLTCYQCPPATLLPPALPTYCYPRVRVGRPQISNLVGPREAPLKRENRARRGEDPVKTQLVKKHKDGLKTAGPLEEEVLTLLADLLIYVRLQVVVYLTYEQA